MKLKLRKKPIFYKGGILVIKLKKVILFFILTVSYSYGLDLDEAHFHLAEKLYNQKNYSESLQEFNQFINKYPDSLFFNKAVIYAARIYYQMKEYDRSAALYSILDKNSRNENDRKISLFGMGENYYRLKEWLKAAESFKKFSFLYTASPTRHAALYYGGKSYKELKMFPEAYIFFECLVKNYPKSPYYQEAIKFVQKYRKSINLENGEYNKTGNSYAIKTTNTVVLTNKVIYSNIGNAVLTNFITNYITNISVSNTCTVITQIISGDYSNIMEIQRLSEENKKKQEELQRYSELIELKAKLLNLKEKAINEKKDFLYNTNEISTTDNTDQ
jgi:tetratricopeptide (TPR) repeat protein